MANTNAWSYPPAFWDYMNGLEGQRGPGRRSAPPPPGAGGHWADFWTQQGPAAWHSHQGFGRRHRGPRPDVFFDHFDEADLNNTDDENAQENDTEKTVTPGAAGEDSTAEAQEPRRRGLGARGGRGRGRGMGGRGLGRGRGRGGMHRHHHHHHHDEDVPMLSENDLTPISSDEEDETAIAADLEKTGLTEDDTETEQTHREFARRGRGRGRGLGRGGMGPRGRGRGRGGFGGRGNMTNVRVNVPGWRGQHTAEAGEGPHARHMYGHGHGHGHGPAHRAQRQQQWLDMMMARGHGPFGGPEHHFAAPFGRHHGPRGFGGPARFNGPHAFAEQFGPQERELPDEESADEVHADEGVKQKKSNNNKNKQNQRKNKQQAVEAQQDETAPNETQASQGNGNGNGNGKGKFPAIDIFNGPEAYEIHANVPGASKDDIEINWNPKTSRLIISGSIAAAGDDDFLTTRSKNERKVGDFKRRVLLGQEGTPANIVAENISARVEDGVLRVVVPKADADLVHVEKEDMQ